jgi:hypothetical protein
MSISNLIYLRILWDYGISGSISNTTKTSYYIEFGESVQIVTHYRLLAQVSEEKHQKL